MYTDQRTSRRDSAIRGEVDRDRLIQWSAIAFTLAVALACTGGGSSGSSGHKNKKDRNPPPFEATVDTKAVAAPAAPAESSAPPRVRLRRRDR